ncbi:MAG: hypothetical protein RIR55_1106, partial [Bacteroidota bacterium]
MTYVQKNKWKFLTTVVLIGGLFFAFNTFQTSSSESPELRHRKLLSTIGHLLESEHYNPRKIDDQFSSEVFDAYLKALDPEKNIFLKSDVASLSVYRKTIDDEIHGAKIEFEPAVNKIFDLRYKESKSIVDSVVKAPFNFNIDDSIKIETDSIAYPSNEKERFDRWYKIIKYKTLERYVTLIEDRDAHKKMEEKSNASAKLGDSLKAKAEDKFVYKSDAVLEEEARNLIAKSYRKRFEQQDKTFNEEKKFDLFLNAITGLMDPHTDYFAPVEKRSFTEQMSGVIYGIGAQLGADDNGVKIAAITPGGPAW